MKIMKLAYPIATPEVSKSMMSFCGDFKQNIANIKAIGYSALELIVRDPEEMDKSSICRMIDQSGLKVAALGCGPAAFEDGLTLLNPDKRVRERALTRAMEIVNFASIWGAPVCIGKYRGQLWTSREKEAMQVLSEAVMKIAAFAEKKGVQILMEPQNKSNLNSLNTTAETVSWIEYSHIPNTGILYDTFQGNLAEVSVGAGILNAKGMIGFVHCSDSGRNPPGTGNISISDALAVLKSTGYDRYLSMEISQRPDSFTAAELAYKSVSYILNYII